MLKQIIYVQYIKYVEAKKTGRVREMHFYLNNVGKSTLDFDKAKDFKTKEDAVTAAKKYFSEKEWSVVKQSGTKSGLIASK